MSREVQIGEIIGERYRLIDRIGARRWIFIILAAWGLISATTAFVRTPAEFYAVRFLLGVAEAGFFPGMVYYLTLWFPDASRARSRRASSGTSR